MRGVVMSLALFALACGPDKKTLAEKEKAELRAADLEKEKTRLEKENDELHAKVSHLEEELKRATKSGALDAVALKAGSQPKVTFETTLGSITCVLWPEKAPLTVANFIGLAEGTKAWTDPKTGQKVTKPLYNGTIFHRVIPNFMIQGGDPMGTGMGGPGYEFEDEVNNGTSFDRPNLLAMANAGPNTNGSQFFITDRSKPSHLTNRHTIFGLCENADVVQAIALAERGANDRPAKDVVIQKVTITR